MLSKAGTTDLGADATPRGSSAECSLGFYIREGRDPGALDALFRARHRVFVEQAGVMPPRRAKRMIDRFWGWPSLRRLAQLAPA